MYRRLAYFLENRLVGLCAPPPDFARLSRVDLLHLSTPDHLEIFLEGALTKNPALQARFSTHLSPLLLSSGCPNLAHLQHKHGVRRVPLAEQVAPGPFSDPPDAGILLFSSRAEIEPSSFSSFRRAFAALRTPVKIIIEGDGSLWRGGRVSRLRRRLLRRWLSCMGPRRDAEEQREMEANLEPDPGYDPANPPRAEVPDYARRKRICNLPTRIEQCQETGTLIKPDLLRRDTSGLYGAGYHGSEFTDARTDWPARLKSYQDRRLRNLRKVGLPETGTFGPNPSALDVGCGTGGFSDLLARMGFETMGVDCSPEAIATASRSYSRPRFQVLPLEKLSRLDSRFDLIVLSHVLEHARDDEALLRSIRTLMKPAGRLYVEVPWMDPPALRARPGWHRQMDHFREYSKRGLWQLAAGCGYEALCHADSFQEEGEEPYQFFLASCGGLPV